MNKNDFLIYLIGLIIIIYIIDNFYLLTKSNENFDSEPADASGNIKKYNLSKSELLDLLKSHIESEIDQIMETETKIESELETKIESESVMMYVSNSGGLVIIIVIIILIICCFSCISSVVSIFSPSTPIQPVQPVQPIIYQYPSIPHTQVYPSMAQNPLYYNSVSG